jgi:hypothetical protein
MIGVAGNALFEQNILWLQIAVNQTGFAEKTQAAEELLGKHSNERGAQASKLVLLDEFVQVDGE